MTSRRLPLALLAVLTSGAVTAAGIGYFFTGQPRLDRVFDGVERRHDWRLLATEASGSRLCLSGCPSQSRYYRAATDQPAEALAQAVRVFSDDIWTTTPVRACKEEPMACTFPFVEVPNEARVPAQAEFTGSGPCSLRVAIAGSEEASALIEVELSCGR